MSLAAGSTFGRYQILSGLGAGGMGEVFLANDTGPRYLSNQPSTSWTTAVRATIA